MSLEYRYIDNTPTVRFLLLKIQKTKFIFKFKKKIVIKRSDLHSKHSHINHNKNPNQSFNQKYANQRNNKNKKNRK